MSLRQGARVAPVLVAIALVGAACGGDDDTTAAGIEAPAAIGPCDAGETPPLQGGSHLLADTEPPVPYSSIPPTSGWHASGAPPTPGIAAPPLSEPEQVSVLEAGGVVVAYDPQALDAAEIAELEQLATGPLSGRITVTAYDRDMPTPVALTAWGVLQRCDAVDTEAITTFVVTHHGATTPEH